MKRMISISVLFFVIVSGVFSTLSFAKDVPKNTKQDNKSIENDHKPTCKVLTDKCSICSDGKKRSKSGDEIMISDYECAVSGKAISEVEVSQTISKALLKLGQCRSLSDFCSICKNGTFIFNKDLKVISSDLFECATLPRVDQRN